ncbi:LuxR C-terminal-related transcriptional regulator [Microbacterium sp. NPDC077184]|uniref:helix-turn-helix transcriptional regulator n=1 Tax=Microbacterium sp. NPDC077184 TaxID=3154764 RepID=UPI00343DC94A
MSITLHSRSVAPATVTPLPRLVRHQIDDLLADADQAPVRALILGPAGSGRSSLVRSLATALRGDGIGVVDLSTAGPLAALAAETVLIIDDAHLLDDATLQSVRARAARTDAALIVAVRPDPTRSELAALTQELERSHPPLILGTIRVEDVLADPATAHLARACAQAMVDRAGGLAWLVSTSLALHDDDCAGPAGHHAIDEALADAIAHRTASLDDDLRGYIEAACFADAPLGGDELIDRGHAAGLLRRNGTPPPTVKAAVCANAPAERVLAGWHGDAADGEMGEALIGLGDERVASFLLDRATATLPVDPQRAIGLFHDAQAAHASRAATTRGILVAHHLLGDLDVVSAGLDAALVDPDEQVTDLAAAHWMARGMAAQADATYRTRPPRSFSGRVQAALAALALGDRTPLDALVAEQAPASLSTADTAAQLLLRGLVATLGATPATALGDLARASDLCTAAGCGQFLPELPAVIAAQCAINVGELDVARSVLADALRGGQGGIAGRDRLRLWSAWVALQRERAHDAEAFLADAVGSTRPLDPRDRLLADALRLATARRYGDATDLTIAWNAARDDLLRTSFDLFSLLPLTEFVVASARVKDPARVEGFFTEADALVEGLGAPIGWGVHLHWAGIQRGILSSKPEDLPPHARVLVAAAAQNRIAAMMAHAGRVWIAVLAGQVDADAVESAAMGLASVGLAWDGARMAGHGARRTDDKRIAARLLACARQLHPREEQGPVDAGSTATAAASTAAEPNGPLSPREREVAELVLQGKTYTEIGATIFISPRTAEHHIARIRRRLGATSRSDLLAKLRAALAGEDASGAPYPAGDESDTRSPAIPRIPGSPSPDPLVGEDGQGGIHRRGESRTSLTV